MTTTSQLLVPPGGLGDEDALDALLAWLQARGTSLFAHQEEAILELFAGKHVILATPTGSGKSLVAMAMHWRGLCRGERSVYTSPIKALVSEKFFDLCNVFGASQVGLMTGDASVNRDAPIICCTAEILANQALAEGSQTPFDHVVMDEFHYYADRDRGMAWQVPLLTMPHATFLLLSATLGDTSQIQADLRQRTRKDVAEVWQAVRPVPLDWQWLEVTLHEAVETLVKEQKTPAYLVHFAQRDASETAGALMSIELCSKEHKRRLAEALHGERFPSPYGKTLQRFLRHGIGLHHAGLLPRYRRLVEKLSQQGLLQILSGTDTLGIGINVPLRTVVLTKLCKYDGETTRLLTARELQQIAGRAGRKGFDTQGYVVALAPEHVVANNRMEAKRGKDGKAVKFVRQKPPERGYAPYNKEVFERLSTARPEALTPVFQVTVGLVLTVLRRGDGGLRALSRLISASHLPPGSQHVQRRTVAQILRSLHTAGVIQYADRSDGKRGRQIRVDAELQDDFSLHHTLSLYLVDALEQLDKAHMEQVGDDAPDADARWALDVLSVVEAILEQPMPVLQAQVQREKSAAVAEMKAEGIEYEERMERLQRITWPKPLANWLYDDADRFAALHPWLPADAVRPKSVAREMVESLWSFDDYVKELDLEPAEGVLLRYLSQVYKTLLQNVPDRWRSPAVWQAIGHLRAVIGQTDSSLVDEWEALRDGRAFVEAAPIVQSISPAVRDKAVRARLAADLLQLVRLLAAERWEDAAGLLSGTVDAASWHAGHLAGLWRNLQDEFGQLVASPQMRLAEHCQIAKSQDGTWTVVQTLFGPEGPTDARLELTFAPM